MAINKGIDSENRNLLSQIKGDERISINKKGQLFVVNGATKTSQLAKPLLSTDEERIHDVAQDFVIDELTKDAYHKLDTGRAEYLKLIDKFAKTNLLDENQRTTLAFSYYNQRYRDLRAVENEWLAEAHATLEMAYDPNIPESFRKGILPEPIAASNLSGAYFLKDRNGKNVAVFKPRMQEAGMPDNPKRHQASFDPNQPKRNQCYGHLQGESFRNEVAAKAIDSEGFIGVPETVLLTVPFPSKWNQVGQTFLSDDETLTMQTGSCQQFVEGKPIAPNFNVNAVPTFEVQKIVIADILWSNADRNLGNLLYDDKQKKMNPIDHGLILLDNLDWEKLTKDDLLLNRQFMSESFSQIIAWPQCKHEIDIRLQKWIQDMDIDEMAKKLKELGKSEGSIREFQLRALFLKEGIRKGLNLYELADLSHQKKRNSTEPTKLDQMVTKTLEVQELDDFLSTFKTILDKKLPNKT